MIKKLLRGLGYVNKKKLLEKYYVLPKAQITYANDLLYTYHNADFLKDPLFIESYKLGRNTDRGTLLKDYDIEWRIHILCWAAFHACKLEGDFVDCGVNTGIFARAVINYVGFERTKKKYYFLDTFYGLDEKYSTPEELERNSKLNYGEENNIYEQVKATFENFNVKIIRGAVPETLPQVDANKICYLSIDMNSAIPEFAALNFFWDKMVSGGIIILDDYGYANAQHRQKEKHDEFAMSKGVKILTLPTCQGLILKP